MERHEILQAMSELKLYGTRASLTVRLPVRALPDAMRYILSSPA